MQLKETHAVVTGGASGLGLAVVKRIVQAGGKATLLDVNEAQGTAAAAALGERSAFIATDVSDEAAVNGAIDRALERMGSINAAINCAGIATPARMVGKQGAMAGAFFRKMIEINLVGTLLVAKAAAVAMQRNTPNAQGERGVIVMTASVAAFDGQIGQVAYSASKGAIVGMTLPMARELASSGIRVMTVAPGLFATPMILLFYVGIFASWLLVLHREKRSFPWAKVLPWVGLSVVLIIIIVWVGMHFFGFKFIPHLPFLIRGRLK